MQVLDFPLELSSSPKPKHQLYIIRTRYKCPFWEYTKRGLMEKGPPVPFMAAVQRADIRMPSPYIPATRRRYKRAATNVIQQYDGLYRFFDEKHPRPNLGFRHQFNWPIRAVSELRLLSLEYDSAGDDGNMASSQDQQGQASGTMDQGGNQEEHSYDTHSDSEDTLSLDETQRLARNRPPPKRYRIVPTRLEYELMFVDELEREPGNRGFRDLKQALRKRYKKDDLINKLMALDSEGNHLGHGAGEGYRYITGDLTFRVSTARMGLGGRPQAILFGPAELAGLGTESEA